MLTICRVFRHFGVPDSAAAGLCNWALNPYLQAL